MLNIIEKLQQKALLSPNQLAYLFLEDGENKAGSLQFAELDHQARKIAVFLQKQNLLGQRVLLLYPTGLDFIVSFIGCLYAGVIAVPVPCPQLGEFEKSANWLNNVVNDADIAGILTVKLLIPEISNSLTDFISKHKIFVTDNHSINERVDEYQLPLIEESTIAYLQYTSGSTSTPKAAIVRHENLTHSLKYTIKAWHYTKKSVTFTWAPHTHVYGLVCGLLIPLYHGTLAIFMPPRAFIQHPVRWLKAITKYQVTHSGCPNFGYDVCVREISESELKDLNLHTWKVAINGGENVRQETLIEFSTKFSVCRFNLKKFNSAFGMSEVSGAISVGQFATEPTVFSLNSEALKNNKVIIENNEKNSKRFVSNGKLLFGLSAIVVNPDTLQQVKENEIGEIWLCGTSVVSGYWRRPDENREIFQAKLPHSDQVYFRTGDLGFMNQDEICLTGRLKEVIVVNGKKYYPLDVESVVGQALKNLSIHQPRVAFSYVHKNHESVIIVQEVKNDLSIAEQNTIIATIHHTATQHFGINLDKVILVKENTIPKTGSGKLQRKLCQKQFLENQLFLIIPQKTQKATGDNLHTFKLLVADVLKIDSNQINLQEPISLYGFDSIHIIKLTALLNEKFDLSLSPAILFEYPTLITFYEKFLQNKEITNINYSDPEIQSNDIAIIGMSGLFPGADSISEFWQNMIEGKDVITQIPFPRWDWQAIYGDPETEDNKTNIKWGGFLNNISQFDAAFFNMSPREAELTDPQQRLFLQTVWHAIEDAGYAIQQLEKYKTGLYVGLFNHDYAEILQKNSIVDAYNTTGLTPSMLANRVSYLLNLQGPSEVIDTACSSSLVAIHHAIQAIQHGDCEIAIVGGVNALLTPTSYISASKAKMLSEDGRCKTFDKNANGYVRSEGVAALILKPLPKALKDYDHIYGVIKGSSVNHGGHVTSLTAPNPNAQADLIITACQRANIPIDTIQYIEAHGTGTALGDPIEINGLKKAFHALAIQQNRKNLAHHYCGIGSVKTHIGHLESAAGIAGVIKVLLSMQHEKIPGNLHFSELNPYIELDNTPFYIVNKNHSWLKVQDLPRRAGISSFGFGGTNAHIILEDYTQTIPVNHTIPSLFSISAKTESALRQRIEDLYTWLLQKNQQLDLSTISYTLNVGRTHFNKRCALIVSSIQELLTSLKQILTNQIIHKEILVQVHHDELVELAKSYVEGNDVLWDQLYSEISRQRISLPTYPFSHENYWVKVNKIPLTHAKLHMLIDENISTLYQQSFIKKIYGNEAYLVDHHVRNEKVLPGTVCIEMARIAGDLANPNNKVKTIKNIKWNKPVNNFPTTLTINVSHAEAVIRFSIDSVNDKSHVEGQIAYDSIASVPHTLDIVSIQNKLANQQSSKQFYDNFEKLEIHYGPSFQVLEQVKYDENVALAKLQLPHLLKDNADQFVLHPNLLDGVLQIVSVLLPQTDILYLPASIDQIDIYDSIVTASYVYAKKSAYTDSTDKPTFILQVTDQNGKILLNIDGFRLCQAQLTKNKNTVFYYHEEWEQENLISQNDLIVIEPILVMSHQGNDVDKIGNLFPKAKIISTQSGDRFRQCDSTKYEINYQLASDYLQLLHHLKTLNFIPKYVILPDCRTREDYFKVVYLSQALMNIKPQIEIQIICFNFTDSLYAEALSGFAKTLHLENPMLFMRVIATQSFHSLVNELTNRQVEVRYDSQGLRWIKKYKKISVNKTDNFIIRHKGVYLITGGLGGLGFIFARYFAENYQASLILTGRTELKTEHKNQLEELKKYGAKITYLRADVSLQTDLQRVIEEIHREFGDLNGVIHAAGILKDSFILKKTDQEIRNVLSPKIEGVIALDEATKNESLDFFVMFSSLSAILGNVGQCDYSYANAFMDAFAKHRQQQRSGKTISINWPLWAEGGAKVDIAIEEWMQKTFGLKTLSTHEGITAFLTALNQNYSQFIVMSGNHHQIEHAIIASLIHKSDIPAFQSEQEITPELRQDIETYLKKLIANVIKLSPDKINSQEAFEHLGIDSVMIILLNQELEKELGILSKTLFFEYQSLCDLTDYFIKNHFDKIFKKIARNNISSIQENKMRKLEPVKTSKVVTNEFSIEIEKNMDIAIIGISGRYPQSPNLVQFWENLQMGKDTITPFPQERWNIKHDTVMSQFLWGGFIDDVDKFDPLFFNISPREAELMDPQERLFLECAWQTVEDAGYARECLAGNKVGVFVGVMYSQYQLFGTTTDILAKADLPNSFFSSIANRVSYYFDWHGPSIALDTMCSSSLTAIHLACQSIRQGESQLAIAGGVNVSIHPNKYHLLGSGNFLASDGRCRSFGKDGDGYVPGEGVGAVLLKSLANALADGDHIYAVIKGSSVNHGGKTNGYTVPNPVAQADVIASAYINSGINPLTVSYIEAHGTGTSLGDPIEMAGLSKVYNPESPITVGSVKSNIGHCESAAGIAALTKVILQMQHQKIVPSLHSEQLNPHIEWTKLPFNISQHLSEWKRPILFENGEQIEYPLRSGINSFGAGGSNVHFILEEAPVIKKSRSVAKPFYLINLSAKTEKALRQKWIDMQVWLSTIKQPEHDVLQDISYTLHVGRSHFIKRCALVIDSMADLNEKLMQLINNATPTLTFINVNLHEKPHENLVLQKVMQQIMQTILPPNTLSTNEYRDNLLALAKFYTDGYDIEWKQLHQNERQFKISMPTYPFAKERYWYSVDQNNIATNETPPLINTTLSQVQSFLLSKVSQLLKINNQDIELTKNLSEYGMDSVAFIHFAEEINKHFHIHLTPAIFYANNHIYALSHHLITQYGTQLRVPLVEKKSRMSTLEPIAIIGMQGYFPQANNVNEFWQNLINGRDCITEVPEERWNWRDYYGDSKKHPDKTNSKWGGFIPGADLFDASFFNISAREANLMDPQHRLFFEIVWQAMEDAGYNPLSLTDQKVGLFAAIEFSEYQTLIAKHHKDFHGFVATGNSHSMLPNRISYFLNLQGPSEAIDTACSSSLVSIHRAVNAIRNGECTLAIAGGVSLMLDPHTFVITSQLGALSPDGRCKTFDKSANGYVKGEGAAAVILKPLNDALQNGDHIYAIIKGSAVNHGGKAQSLTAPNAISQTELLIDAYSQDNINVETISYIETHGTGTSLGDPVEIEGLKQAFHALKSQENKHSYCGLGSVKTQIGHLEPASGIAGLIKVLLSLHHKKIPGNLHLKELNPYIDLKESPFYLINQNQSWTPMQDKNGKQIPRRAGISSFGFGGTNAHVLVEEVSHRQTVLIPKPCYLITLSAKQEVSLKKKITDLYQWLLSQTEDFDLSALGFTLSVGRAHFEWRCVMIVSTTEELQQTLYKLINNETTEFCLVANSRGHQSSPIYDDTYHSITTAIQDNHLDVTQYRNKLWLLADLYTKNYPIDWNLIFTMGERKRLPLLPSYPFERQRYWFDNDKQVISPQSTQMKNTNETSDTVIDYLKQIFSEKLQIPASHIATDETYEIYGVDSVLGLEITERLQKDFSTLPKTILYEKNQLKDLADYLIKHYHSIIQDLFNVAIDTIPAISVANEQVAARQLGDIAIIGISGIFPMAKNLEEFWNNLKTKRDCVGEVPADRWNYQDYPVMVGGETKYFKHGGFIEDVDKFDPLFFNISPRDAALMDPQERLFLQSTWTTLEDAGYTRERLQKCAKNHVGVFVGVTYNYYPLFIAEEWQKGNQVPLDIQMFSVANRVSYFLNLTGPSLVVDTACSSALAAIHLACESILHGECEMAIAGGVNLSLHPSKYHFLGSFSFMSDQGRCTSFAEGGTGYVPSEGVGSILLKPLDKAIKDNDRIYGVIKSSSMNHGGKTSGYTVPNPNGQASVIKNALIKAQIDPRTISYIEAHGTGTSLGDPIEIRGLQEAFETYTQDKQFCAIGSVKSNIGHLESAAGVSQLAKVLLQMREKTLVPSLHAENLNSFIDFSKTPFYVQRELNDWSTVNNQPRRAGISSFGAGGANVHIIVEEFIPINSSLYDREVKSDFALFIFSAMNAERLQEYARIQYEFLQNHKNQINERWLMNMSYTLQTGRESFPARCAIVFTTYDDLIRKIKLYIDQPNQVHPDIWVNLAVQVFRDSVPDLNNLINMNQYHKLAELWIKGCKITWELLYQDKFPERIALPTYPFAKRRCWIPTLTKEPSPLVVSEDIKDWLYTVEWESKDVQRIHKDMTSKKSWLIFSDKELGFILHDELNKNNCILCFAGDQFTKIDEQTYYINPELSDDYAQLFNTINTRLSGIIYLWSQDSQTKQKIEHQTRLLALYKTLAKLKTSEDIQFCFVSRGSQCVMTNDVVDTWQHHLWSITRIFSAEQAHYKTLMIDLDNNENLRHDAKFIVHQLNNFLVTENHIALRSGQRFVLRFSHLVSHGNEVTPWKSPDTVIITGGLGALGIEVAKWLVSQGCKYLLITGTTLIPPRDEWKNVQDSQLKEKIQSLVNLEQLNVTVSYFAVDVSNKLQMEKIIAQTENEWKKPIKGVFHLAGITTDNMPIVKTDEILFEKVFSVKARGALVLHEIFNKPDLHCFVLFSSIAAVPYFGMSGLSAYAMANAFLNGLALSRRQQGLPASSINWVAWAEKGMSFKYNHSDFLDAIGMSSLSIAQGIGMMPYLLALNPANATVCKINWNKFLLLNAETKKIDFFTHFVKSETKQNLVTLTLNRNQITEVIMDNIVRFLQLEKSELDEDTPFQNYGMDSIIGINFVAALNVHFPDIISPMDLYRYPTLKQLVDFISLSCDPAEQEKNVSINNNFSEEQFIQEIENLSHEQLTEMIEKEINILDI